MNILSIKAPTIWNSMYYEVTVLNKQFGIQRELMGAIIFGIIILMALMIVNLGPSKKCKK